MTFENTTEALTRSTILPASCMSIVLASASPRRRKLLEQLGFELQIVPSSVDETFDHTLAPSEMAKQLAYRKAADIAQSHLSRIVLGADTIVVVDGSMIAKPDDAEDACKMLARLSGRSHQVWTGVSLIQLDRNLEISFSECTEVQFAPLTSHEIEAYVATGSPLDKAGAYGIQDDWGAVFVSGIKGDYYNVVGLPLHAMYRNLLRFV